MNLRILIADDEPLALDGLQIMLARVNRTEVVARCKNGSEAIRDIRQFRPDLVILDIDMPGLTGFDVVSTFNEANSPAVVFSTAHDQFAVRAFSINASGYLLKPVDEDSLQATVENVRRQIGLRAAANCSDGHGVGTGDVQRRSLPGRIVIRSPGRVHFLEPSGISWLEASGDYVQVHGKGKAHMLRASLRQLTEDLGPHGFCRVHRSAAVNLAYVRELIATDNGDHELVLTDGTSLRLSRTFRDGFFAAMRGAEAGFSG